MWNYATCSTSYSSILQLMGYYDLEKARFVPPSTKKWNFPSSLLAQPNPKDEIPFKGEGL
jgi:hypothetical protein